MNGDEQHSTEPQRQARDFRGEQHIHRPSPADTTDAATRAEPPVSIDLHIEEIILHSFEPGDRFRIADAVERELFRLMTERGVPSSLVGGGEAAMLDAGEFNALHPTTPEAIGAQLARAVYEGLS